MQGFISWLETQNADKNLRHLIKSALLNGACYTGSESSVTYLLSKGVTPDDITPFCIVEGGSVLLLRKLLKYDVIHTARADKSLLSSHPNINVLHQACLYDRKEMVTILCETYPNLVNDIDDKGMSPFYYVVAKGSYDMFNTLKKPVMKSLCRVEDEQHKCESEAGNVELSLQLCELYPTLITAVTNEGLTILHNSCGNGHSELSLQLCELYPTLTTAVTNDGLTILHLSCSNGHRELSLQLCELYPTLTTAVTNEGLTTLHNSCGNGHRSLVLQLCELYPTLTTAVTNEGETILHYSCSNGHKELCLQLCELYPTLTTVVTEEGYNCLHAIARFTSDVDLFTECERHVKQYVEKTGGKYDITTMLTTNGSSVLDMAQINSENKSMYLHLVQLFAKK
ncbi:ankyrin repeat, PH and SEC7 domain containing protein secG-like [Argopecten irradians]|uniref:ankyrin repeat, PH and SEC7 domain containing protein secG-like n=1 Tax=Argopecten irradians TaxID=31199 RepID=UPI0037180580